MPSSVARLSILILLFVVNAFYLGYLSFVFAQTRKATPDLIKPGQTILLASAAVAVVIFPTLGIFEHIRRDDLSKRRWQHASTLSVTAVALLQLAAAGVFTATSAKDCTQVQNKMQVMSPCNPALRFSTWIVPSLALLLCLYLVVSSLGNRSTDSESDTHWQPLARSNSTALARNKSLLRPPPPAYAFTAAGAIRRWSQSLLQTTPSPTNRDNTVSRW